MRFNIAGIVFLGLSCYVLRTTQLNDDISTRAHSPNKFLTLRTFCSRDALTVVAITENVFDGALYARGYPSECRELGNNSREVRLTMDVSACGIKVEEKDDGRIEYEITVHLQYDRTVQRSIDEELSISCIRSDNHAGEEAGKIVPKGERRARLYEGKESPRVGHRYSSTDCWLDILRGGDDDAKPVDDFLRVGETANVVVKVHEKAGIESKVVDCVGHDGTEETTQPLVDKNGCSVDDNIMPSFTETGGNGGPKWFRSSFSAFKFPDRDYLHVKCVVLICVHKCPVVNCGKIPRFSDRNSSAEDYKTAHIANVIEVFNSVQVQAPDIEIDNFNLRRNEMNANFAREHRDDDDFICTSPIRLIVTFGLLIGIFIVAVLISAFSYFWIKLQRRLVSDSESVIYFPYSPSESYS